MKKLLALLLAIFCCFGMVACGEDNSKALDDAIAIINNLYKDTTVSPADFTVVGSVKVGDKTADITWTTNLSTVKVVKDGKFYKIDVPAENAAETTYALTATVKIGKQTKTKTFNITLPVIILNVFEAEPAEGQAYKLMLTQVTLGKNLFAIHDTQNANKGQKYIKTTEDATAAPDFFAEKVEGGYKLYTMIEGAKKYVTASLPIEDGKENPSKYLGYSDEGTVWYYKADCKAWFTKIDGGEYVLGTYSTFNTLCISDGSYMKPDTTGVTQFPGNLITLENVSKLSPVEKPEQVELPEANSTLTIAKIIELAEKMTSDIYSEGKYYVVGEITEVYNTTYGNMKIKDADGNILTIYGTYSADGETRYDALTTKPVAGDTVKIYGIIGQYNGTPQVKNGWIVEHTAATGGNNSGNTGNQGGNTGNTGNQGGNTGNTGNQGGNTGNTGNQGGNTGNQGGTTTPPASSDPAANSVLTIEQAIALGSSKEHDNYTTDKYYVVGEITEVYNTTYGNMKIKDAKGNILTIYGTYSADGKTRYDAMATKPAVGDTVKIYGVIGQYNSTPQIKNGWLAEHTPAAGGNTGNQGGNTGNQGGNTGNTGNTGNQTLGAAATSLEVGKGYVITANNSNGAIYVTGNITSGRFDAATSSDSAAVFYVEAGAESGDYLLYFMKSGTKTYVIMEDESKGGKTTTTAADATVFIWKADLKTLVVKDPDNARAFGAQDSSTYANLSTYAVSNTTGYNWGQFLPVA